MSATTETRYEFAPQDRPTFPGPPAAPAHPVGRRLGYAAVALQLGDTATLGNGLVNGNVASLSGALGVCVAHAK